MQGIKPRSYNEFASEGSASITEARQQNFAALTDLFCGCDCKLASAVSGIFIYHTSNMSDRSFTLDDLDLSGRIDPQPV